MSLASWAGSRGRFGRLGISSYLAGFEAKSRHFVVCEYPYKFNLLIRNRKMIADQRYSVVSPTGNRGVHLRMESVRRSHCNNPT